MLDLIFTIIKNIWPFLKESALEGGTFKDWLKRNWVACIWLSMLTVSALAGLYLSIRALDQNNEIARLTGKLDGMSIQLTDLQKKFDDQAIVIRNLNNEIAISEEKNKNLRGFLEHCGMDSTYTSGPYPTCPVKRVVVNHTVTKTIHVEAPPKPVEHKPTLKERLRAVFSNKKEDVP